MGFNQGKFSNHKKINGTTMFAILFAMFLLVIGVIVGATYSAFQSTATSSGTLTFAVNGHQGSFNLSNTKVASYNSTDLTLIFTLSSETNYNSPTITGITMGGTPLTQESTNFKSDSIVVATYSSNTLTINRANVTGNLIITGSSTASTYTIEYNSNSGVGTMNDTIANYNSFATLRANTFIRVGYTFAGWATSASGDIVYVDSAPVKDLGNITLYAKWVANTNVITLNNQNALSTGSTSVVATYGNALPNITIPIKGAMIFDGYYTEQNGAGIQYYAGNGTSANNWAGTSDTTLYANWIYAIKFSSVNNITLKSNAESITWKQANGTNGLIEYKTDAEDWVTWDGTIIGGAQGDETKNIYLRGTGNAKIAGSGNNWVLTGTNISCSGNIETLLDYATVAVGNHPIMITSCYDSMFYNCTNLVNAPVLPATTLVNSCYRSMFQGCTNLENVPELPVTDLTGGGNCYFSMFQDCTSLVNAPELPATTLVSGCYCYMFSGCTSLVSAPELPAATLAMSCYLGMFRNCTSLVSAPELQATNLGSNCYKQMFEGCSSLANAPELPATVLANSCYYYMFNGCSSLANAPTLPATTMAYMCYNGMFQGCTSLSAAPALPATTLESSCYSNMFSGCTSLIDVEMDIIRLDFQMFSGCTNLVSITLLKPSTPVVALSNINALPFSNSGFKVYVPKDLLATYKAATNWSTYASQIYAMPYYMVGSMGYVTLAEAVAGASSGDTIYLKRDTAENISTAITINKNLTITSYGDIKQIDINFTGYTETLLAINSSYTLTISNITFNNIPNASYYGRAIVVNGGALFVMNNETTIQNFGYKIGSTATSGDAVDGGGGVLVNQNGAFNMNGGTIDNCGSYYSGGGVSVHGGWDENNTSRFNMSSGTISNCWCQENSGDSGGGGVYIDGFAVFTMSGGAICNNYSHMNGSGGGVEIFEATFRMTGGSIYGNTSKSGGGGVCVWVSDEDAYFYMTGGSIYNSTGTNDAANNGVYINYSYFYYQPSNANQIGYLDISSTGWAYNSAGTSDWTGINSHSGTWKGTWDPSILNN